MKTTLLQMDIAWGDPQENIQRAETLMAGTSSDLYVLPEMWATGFATEPAGIAEDEEQSVALQWMKQCARDRGCALSGSLAVRLADGSYRNRHYFVTPSGVSFYDKHHLFTYGGEHLHYTAGQSPVIVSWQGLQLLLLTCYDLRFPVFSRYGRAGAYDVIVYVANWPASRQSAWDVLTRARAIENQCYVVAVNRVGQDPVAAYGGGSVIIDPIGRVLTDGCGTADISLERLQQMRSRFRVLDDRDD